MPNVSAVAFPKTGVAVDSASLFFRYPNERQDQVSYEQSFLYAAGEPDRVALDQSGNPRSVWSAIHAFQADHPKMWIAMAQQVFGLRGPRDAALLMAEGVMARIEETAKCDLTQNPAKVYIDREKRFYVEVYQ